MKSLLDTVHEALTNPAVAWATVATGAVSAISDNVEIITASLAITLSTVLIITHARKFLVALKDRKCVVEMQVIDRDNMLLAQEKLKLEIKNLKEED